jgi:fructose-bisphosphate aldolase class I
LGRIVFGVLREQEIDLGGMLYKPNMVVPGKECATQPDAAEVAKRSVEVMKKIVSVNVPGIVFLSGGQESGVATVRLNTIAQVGAGAPWRWSFSFERALEAPAMEAWQGKNENRDAAQKVLLHRAKMNSIASLGTYTKEAEDEI